MQRIVILGGGVGGTLTANLLIKKLRRQVKAGERADHRRRPDRPAHLPAWLHVHRDGRRTSRPASAPRARACWTSGSPSLSGRWPGSTSRHRPSSLTDGLPIGYDYLVLATGSRIVPEAIEHFDTRGHHFYTAEAALELRAGARRFKGGRIVIGIAGMPYKCPPAPLEVDVPHRGGASRARATGDERDPLLFADRARVHDRERVRDGDPDP